MQIPSITTLIAMVVMIGSASATLMNPVITEVSAQGNVTGNMTGNMTGAGNESGSISCYVCDEESDSVSVIGTDTG
jgi:hypothetical protein